LDLDGSIKYVGDQFGYFVAERNVKAGRHFGNFFLILKLIYLAGEHAHHHHHLARSVQPKPLAV